MISDLGTAVHPAPGGSIAARLLIAKGVLSALDFSVAGSLLEIAIETWPKMWPFAFVFVLRTLQTRVRLGRKQHPAALRRPKLTTSSLVLPAFVTQGHLSLVPYPGGSCPAQSSMLSWPRFQGEETNSCEVSRRMSLLQCPDCRTRVRRARAGFSEMAPLLLELWREQLQRAGAAC